MEPAGGMAIALPFSLTMEPLPGIILLLGCYGGAWYGGAIPAILIRVPGTPVNVLTTYDGYPLARKGQPMRALSIAYSSSFIGGILSIMALIFLAPSWRVLPPTLARPSTPWSCCWPRSR
jgi:putative tricarboxylic transport membrane protein